MIRRPPRSTLDRSSAASDVYKRQDKESAHTSYGACGMLVKMDGFTSSGGGTVVYFGCKDCAAEASRVEQNGGALVKEKISIGAHGFIALARDTEGNMIGFHSM